MADLGVPNELQGSTFSLRSSMSSRSLSLFHDLTGLFASYDSQSQRERAAKPARYMQASPPKARQRDASPPQRHGEGRGGLIEPTQISWSSAKLSGPESTPRPRAGATLSRVGTGHNALLILFGGYEGHEGALAEEAVKIFDPINCKWCLPEEVGIKLRGQTPPTRAGHSASAMGRHVLVYFGGQAEQGMTNEVFALVQHRSEMSVNPRSCALTWTAPTVEPGRVPMPRVHHAATEMGADGLLVFGGEVRLRAHERDQMIHDRRADQPALPPLNARAEVGLLSASASSPALLRANSPRSLSTASLGSRATTAALGVRGSPRVSTTRGMSRPKSRANLLLRPIKALPIAEREPPTAASRPSTTNYQQRKEMRWVQHALADLWGLRKNAKNRLQWRQLEPSGDEPPPRSRAVFVGLPQRGLALLFGGRSMRASVVLNDAYVLDVAMATWARITLCGVPPTPREGATALVFGPDAGVLIVGGKGHVAYSDACCFSLGRHMRSGQSNVEMGEWSAPFKQGAEPLPRHAHMAARLGTARLVVFGGEVDDLGYGVSFLTEEPPALVGACEQWALSTACVSLSSVRPERVKTKGGDSLVLRGRGFRSECQIRVRFSAPQALPPNSKTMGALRYPEDDLSVVVDAVYVDQFTVSCVVPDLLSMMCDGYVLVEACMTDLDSGGRDEWWTTDEVLLAVASEPQQIVSLRPMGGKLSSLPVCTRYTRRLRAIDDRGRRPALELALEVKMAKKEKGGAAAADGANKAATGGGAGKYGAPPPKPTCEASLTYLGEGTYELSLWTEQMGAFEVEISSAVPVPAAPPKKEGADEEEADGDEGAEKEPKEVPCVYAKFTITATPGPTHPPSCLLNFAVDDEQDEAGHLSLVAGNVYPFTVARFDHVGNAVDGLDRAWTWLCEPIDGPAAEQAASPKRVPFKPGSGDRLQLPTAGVYLLYVRADEDLIPALASQPAAPVRLTVTPAALSPVHSTFYGSGIHSRYPDMPEDKQDSEREVILIARDAHGNRLGYSPPWLCDSFHVSLQPIEVEDAASGPPEIAISDTGEGVLRAVHPILPLGTYALSVMLASEVLLSKRIVSGTGKQRPKDAPHWSEEEGIFAAETSVALQRAEDASASRAAIAEQNAKTRFQRQFKKKGAPEASPPKKKLLNAAEIFSVVDADGSGSVSQDEMRTFMRQRGYDGDEIELMIKRLDTDGDGEISAKEFTEGLAAAESDPTLEDLLTPYEAPDSVFDSIRVGEGCVVDQPELRAISLAQLKHLYLEQVVKRCAAEEWIGRRQDPSSGTWRYTPLTAETVNLYDLASYVIVPATAPRQCSYVELVAEGAQPPSWVVSAGWRLPLHQLIACLEVHAKDAGLGGGGGGEEEGEAGGAPPAHYWISAFSNNQHELTSALPADPRHSVFYKAMERSLGLVSLVDDGAECFSRIWCNHEAHLAVSAPPSATFRHAYYTAMAHEYREGDAPGAHTEMRGAVGLLEGLACDVADPSKPETLQHRLRRERAFPTYLLEAGMSDGAAIELGESTRPADRIQILGSLAGGGGGEPPASHERYDKANALLRGRLASAALNEVLSNTTPSGVIKRGRFLTAVRSGSVRKVDVSVGALSGKAQLKALADLLDALDPSCLEELRVGHCTELGREDAILRQDEEPVPPPMAPKEIERVLDFMQLTSLSLLGASSVEAVPPVSFLMRLQVLDLRDCTSLVAVPDDVCDLRDLRRLLLSGCTSLVRLPTDLGGTDEDGAAAPPEPPPVAEDAAGEAAGEADGADAAAEPMGGLLGGSKLEYLELIGCTGLRQLPDLSKVANLTVELEGCNRELAMMWEAGGRKPFMV